MFTPMVAIEIIYLQFLIYFISKHMLPNNVISILIRENQMFNDIDSLHTNLLCIGTYWLQIHHINFDYN